MSHLYIVTRTPDTMFYYVSTDTDTGHTFAMMPDTRESVQLTTDRPGSRSRTLLPPHALIDEGIPAKGETEPEDVDPHFTWMIDPGHGWLQVERGLYDKVCKRTGWNASSYSYEEPGFVYLEEDCDGPYFLRLLQAWVGYRIGPFQYSEKLHSEWVRDLDTIS